MDSRAIGVYDSGMGGISLWRAIRSLLPHESIVYLGDGKNCPYGDKSPAEVTKLAFEAVEVLLKHGCKMIVVACNTATSTAISELREAYPQVPFVGMEPAIKPACLETKSGVVMVLATKRSLESDLFAATLAKYADGVEVIKQVGEGLVEIVEAGMEESQEALESIKVIVDVAIAKGVDKIVLGCTHYPFLSSQITKAIGDNEIDIIDPSLAIIRRIERLLTEFELGAPKNGELNDQFISFADDSYCNKLINKAKSSVI
ncbi:MAG: glutamate racemase [Rikenellaceae bacterium]